MATRVEAIGGVRFARRTALGATGPKLTPGVVAYFVDTSLETNGGVIRVLPIDDADQVKGAVTLQPLGALTHRGVTVTVLSRDSTGDRVRVVR